MTPLGVTGERGRRPAARPDSQPGEPGKRALVLTAACVRLRSRCRAPASDSTISRRAGGRRVSGSPHFTRKWLLKNMALLLRALVSEGVMFYGRPPGSGVGVRGGGGGMEQTDGKCRKGVCAGAKLPGAALRGN